MMVNEPLSNVVVLLFVDVEGCENNAPIRGGVYVWEPGASGRGKAEVVSNDGKGGGLFRP